MSKIVKRRITDVLNTSSQNLISKFADARSKFAEKNPSFIVNRDRIKVLKNASTMSKNGGIIYWMCRDQRVLDNWALLYAQELANDHKCCLVVVFCLQHKFLEYNRRHVEFITKGLSGIHKELNSLNIPFYIEFGNVAGKIIDFSNKLKDKTSPKTMTLISDFNPLPEFSKCVEEISNNLSKEISFIQVDTHNIIPCWNASDKKEFSARTIRPKITKQLSKYLTEFPPIKWHKYNETTTYNDEILKFVAEENSTPKAIKGILPGYDNAVINLDKFLTEKLERYNEQKNDPSMDCQSDLSSYLNFGHISSQRVALAVNEHKKTHKMSVAVFLEELIVRKELSDNFCYYSNSTKNIYNWIPKWAEETLSKHKNDPRQYCYTLSQLENMKTHDELWNAAQNQMMKSGKMHGYMRMYWAKKILEWSESPEDALRISLKLNNRYNLDGCDPNSIVGCLWSVAGVHDRPWRERPIFGTIRYMNEAGCKRKFNTSDYIKKWGNIEDSTY